MPRFARFDAALIAASFPYAIERAFNSRLGMEILMPIDFFCYSLVSAFILDNIIFRLIFHDFAFSQTLTTLICQIICKVHSNMNSSPHILNWLPSIETEFQYHNYSLDIQ
jgi:hypothetical protein